MNTRRTFLSALLTAGAAAAFSPALAAAQTPDASQEKQPLPADTAPETPLPPMNKGVLEQNEKEIKKKVEKLYDLAAELKTEVEKTDSTKVLSLNLVRKAEEIEKLARDIKNRSRG